MKRSFSVVVAAALVSGAVLAQPAPRLVFPTQASGAEGSVSVDDHTGGVPWWPNESQLPGAMHFRMQLVTGLPAGYVGTIESLSFRRDGAFRPGLNLQPFFVEMEITMSTAINDATTLSGTFAANVGADAQVVVPRQVVPFGGQQFDGTFPEPFKYTIRLATPFQYDSSKGPLLIDVKHWSNDLKHPSKLTPTNIELDSMPGGTMGPTLPTGSRCPPPRAWSPNIDLNPIVEVDDSSGSAVMRFWAWRQHAQHHSRGFLLGSFERVAFGTGFPVYSLSPGSCGTIDLDLNATFGLSAVSNSNDYGDIRWPEREGTYVWELPWNPRHVGFKFWVQELNDDVHTEDYQVSNMVLVQSPNYMTQPPASRVVYADGFGSHGAPTGTMGPIGRAPVIAYNN
ncbi:MAG: hypothetical protein AAF628_04820 [Planctomycetota bacterium]